MQLNDEKMILEANQDLINPSKFEADYYKIKLEGIINVNGSDEPINKDFSFDIKSQQDYFKKITDQNVENFQELGNKFFQSGGFSDDIEDNLKLNLKLLRSKFAQFTELNKVLEKYLKK